MVDRSADDIGGGGGSSGVVAPPGKTEAVSSLAMAGVDRTAVRDGSVGPGEAELGTQ